MLEQLFKLSENKTTVRTEMLAGITTFLTMAYIIFVNPEILGEAGMPNGAVFVATCLAAALGSCSWGSSPTTRSRWRRAWGSTPTSPSCVVGSMRFTLAGGAGRGVHLGLPLLDAHRAAVREWIVNGIPHSLQDGDRGRHRPVPRAHRAEERRHRGRPTRRPWSRSATCTQPAVLMATLGFVADRRARRTARSRAADPDRHPRRDHRLDPRRPAEVRRHRSPCRRRSRRCFLQLDLGRRARGRPASTSSSPSCSSTCSTTPAR